MDMDPGQEAQMDMGQGQVVLWDMVPDLVVLLVVQKDTDQDQVVPMDMYPDLAVPPGDLHQVSTRHTNTLDMDTKVEHLVGTQELPEDTLERLEDILEHLEDTLEHPGDILERLGVTLELAESTLVLPEDTLDIPQWEVLERHLHQVATGPQLLQLHQTKTKYKPSFQYCTAFAM